MGAVTLGWRTSIRGIPNARVGAGARRWVPALHEPPAGSAAQRRILDGRVPPAGSNACGRQASRHRPAARVRAVHRILSFGSHIDQGGQLAKLYGRFSKWAGLLETSIRELAEHLERLIHYSAGKGYTRILATEFTRHIGREEEPDYDRVVAMGPELRALVSQVLRALEEHSPLGRIL